MMTRKELIGGLISQGIIVTNPVFETEDLETIFNEVCDILDDDDDDDGYEFSYDDADNNEEDEVEEDAEDEVEEINVSEQELIGREEGETEVVHLLYPGQDHYPLLMEWAERMKGEYENVDLKYSEDQDAFVFYAGDVDEALAISEKMIEDIQE